MIACPHCEREFEKRAGLMRHVTSSHADEPYTGDHYAVPVNPGGAIEPLVPVEPETYAESLDEVAPGQEPYIDPPASETEPTGWLSPTGKVMGMWSEAMADAKRQIPIPTPVRLTMDDEPSPTEYKQIRALIRSGRPESEAWMAVVGHEPPPRPPQPVDERPVRLQQVAFRVRNGGTDQIDARWLLHLAEIGAEAVAHLGEVEDHTSISQSIIDRWKAALQ